MTDIQITAPSASQTLDLDAPVFPKLTLVGLAIGLLAQAADPIISSTSTADIIGVSHNSLQAWVIAFGMTMAGALAAFEAGRHTTHQHVPKGVGWVPLAVWFAVGAFMVTLRLMSGSLSGTGDASSQYGAMDKVIGILMAGLYLAAGVGIYLSTSTLVHHPWYALRSHIKDMRQKNQVCAVKEAALARSVIALDHLNETMDLAVRDGELAKQIISHQAMRLKQIARDEHTRLNGDPGGASHRQPHAPDLPHPDEDNVSDGSNGEPSESQG